MRRLTDLWPNLLGRFRQGEEEGREPRQIVQGEENEESQLLLEAYENLYWTRVIAVRDFLEGTLERHELGPDIVEAKLEIEEALQTELEAGLQIEDQASSQRLPGDEQARTSLGAAPARDPEGQDLHLQQARWRPRFDPQAFQQEQPSLALKDWILTEHQLRLRGRDVSRLRTRISEQADLLAAEEAGQQRTRPGIRSRKGLTYSTAARNPDGQAEKEIRRQYLLEKPTGRKYKARCRNELNSRQIDDIVATCEEGALTQREVAKQYKVKEKLVCTLVNEAKRMPERQDQLKQKEKEQMKIKKTIEIVAEKFLERSIPIKKASMVQSECQQLHGLEVPIEKVRRHLKEELGLGYRMARKVPLQANSERCLVLRQRFALVMLDLLLEGKRVMNVDESWLNETTFTRKIWCPSNAPATITQRTVAPRLSLIAALDTEGRVYFSLTQATTDSDVMLVFLRHLKQRLDQEDVDWASKTIILLDGARYHTSELMREYLRKLQLQVVFSAPYSYQSAPIELLFSQLKLGELNPEREPTGKKVSRCISITDSVEFTHRRRLGGRVAVGRP